MMPSLQNYPVQKVGTTMTHFYGPCPLALLEVQVVIIIEVVPPPPPTINALVGRLVGY
jgi:hypothetical protein